MFAFQGKAGFVVIKFYGVPALDGVAIFAFVAKVAFMHVCNCVATEAGCFRKSILLPEVAGIALYLGVFAFQWELRIVVVEG